MSSPHDQLLDLEACAREPIHLLGRTQDFGVLLALDVERRIVAASGNVAGWCGLAASPLLGCDAERVLPRGSVDAAFAHASVAARSGNVQHLFAVGWPGRDAPVDVSLHTSGARVVIEAEPAGPGPAESAQMLEASTRDLAACNRLDQLAASAARAVAGLTGYDRVMVYRFAADGSGTVLAEQRAAGMPPYLGLRYPASDIPAQARELYLRNPIRLIVDATHDGLAVAGLDAQPLDLSMATLRSVSPVHLQYLRNMGIAASMSVSLVIDGKLWGLIACHHRAPRRPPLACRSMAELLGRLYALAIARLERQTLEASINALLLKAPGVDVLVDPAAERAARDAAGAAIGRMFGASGAVLQLGGQLFQWGQTPAPADSRALAAGLAAGDEPLAVHAIESLAARTPEWQRLAPAVAGMLALPLSSQWRDWLLLLRDEVQRHVVWAGEPVKAVDERTGALTPRASFAAWRESVRLHCEPWTPIERELAETLRTRLLEALLAWREQRELDQIRQSAQQQSLLVRELNHRVRNMLGLIKGLVHQTARGSSSIEELTTRLEDRVHALSRAYTQIEKARWQPAALAGLVCDEVHAFAEPTQLALHGAAVNLEPNAYLAFAMVIHELATNARKYGALSSPAGRLDVSWRVTPKCTLELEWHESGGPAVTPPRHKGFGTQVINQALAHQLRGQARLAFEPEGLRAHLSAPRGFVTTPTPAAATAPLRERVRRTASRMPRRSLVVEDDLVIALTAEALLRRLGCVDVVLAGSQVEALAALRAQTFDFAMLDVNLGDHDSSAVARQLVDLGVPVVLATGYSDNEHLPAAMRGLPRICKPYAEADLRAALAEASSRAQAPRLAESL